jgi:hypothetical protein
MKCEISEDLIKLIQDDLYKKNEFYKQFKHIGKEILSFNCHLEINIVDDYCKLLIKKQEIKLYELPSNNDFGGIIPNEADGNKVT